jgi:hypothetical protein
MEKAALDKALREMMRAAGDLPVPDHLLQFVEDLEAQLPANDAELKAG